MQKIEPVLTEELDSRFLIYQPWKHRLNNFSDRQHKNASIQKIDFSKESSSTSVKSLTDFFTEQVKLVITTEEYFAQGDVTFLRAVFG